MLLFLAILSLVLILLEMPVSFAILGASIVAVTVDSSVFFNVIATGMIQGMDSFILLAIPLFVLVGYIMNTGGITNRLLQLALVLVGRLPGGLAHVNVVSSMIFSGMSGTTVSDVAGLGRVEIPMMTKAGYTPSIAAVVTSISSCIGPIIPPSVTFILFGALTNTSVGRLFIGGAIPGILLGFSFMGVIAYQAHKGKFGPVQRIEGKLDFREIWVAFIRSFWALITPAIIMGGIILGFFTPTEAAGIAVFYSLFITIFIYKEITLRTVFTMLCDAAEFIGVVMLMVGAASIFGWLLTQAGISDVIVGFIKSMTSNRLGVLLVINAVMLIMGCFIEATSLIILLSPMLMPIVNELHLDPVHFGVMFTINIMTAVITPPVGICAYIASDIAGITMQQFAREIGPYIIALLIFLLFIILFPPVVTFLPNLLFG